MEIFEIWATVQYTNKELRIDSGQGSLVLENKCYFFPKQPA